MIKNNINLTAKYGKLDTGKYWACIMSKQDVIMASTNIESLEKVFEYLEENGVSRDKALGPDC